MISQGDKQLFIQPDDDGWYQDTEVDSIVPNRDKIRIGNKLYKVITFKQINPSTQDSVLFECYVRNNGVSQQIGVNELNGGCFSTG